MLAEAIVHSFKLGRYFGAVMMMESGLLFLSCILYAGTADVTAQYAAAMAMGLQNGAATRFSGAVVRYVWGPSACGECAASCALIEACVHTLAHCAVIFAHLYRLG
jgi:hypothetical protein